ncbi:MAG: methyltransferase domain-containing protein [Archaeoglobus sp.]|nr:methyltransferase domain-containing protein [Archaeoglobus sp.]
MRYGFFLSGEFPELARLEILNLLPSYSEFKVILEEPRILIVESEVLPEEFFSRLALTREAFIHLESLDLDGIWAVFSQITDKFTGKRVCVRVKKLDKRYKIKSPELERELGAILWREGAKIDLKNPQKMVKVYISEKCHVGVLRHVTDTRQFLERRPDLKPFFKPGALKPRFGRALVNLSGIRDGILLDPMCGTGTILIEAGLIGLDFCGIEAFRKVAYGCVLNLEFYGLPLNVLIGDVRRIPFKDETVDGIVTDYPYLRSSKSLGELESLYEKSLVEIYRVLKSGKKAVLISNRDLDDSLKEFNFKIETKLQQEVHRSLSRKIYVLKK